MKKLSKYWHIWKISSVSNRDGYQVSILPLAQVFFLKQFGNKNVLKTVSYVDNQNIQVNLLSYFDAKNSTAESLDIIQAGFCLRCYISGSILKACQKIAYLFGNQNYFTYRDLLPFVLNDDGQTPLVIDRDRQTQMVLDSNNGTRITAYSFFSVKVLQTYQANVKSKMSLDNWAYLQTKQNQELRSFLSEFGFKHLSDWALLNQVKVKQIELLFNRDRHLVEVFHDVYRRDRRRQKQRLGKCPDPSNAQLKEMQIRLQERDVAIGNLVELLASLRQLAIHLRQYDIWAYREPLELYHPDTQTYTTRSDLPSESLNTLDIELQELLAFIESQSTQALMKAIVEGILKRLRILETSKNYALLAEKFLPGLRLYYCQGLSLREIAPQLGLTNWDRARRILNPGELLYQVRSLYMQHLLDQMLERASKMGLTQIPPKPNYLKELIEQIEAFADAEIFQKAAKEIRTGKNRSMQSLYAQQLRRYLGDDNDS
jgi:predicted DNA-binding protein YlxM (UPF0122 family)